MQKLTSFPSGSTVPLEVSQLIATAELKAEGAAADGISSLLQSMPIDGDAIRDDHQPLIYRSLAAETTIVVRRRVAAVCTRDNPQFALELETETCVGWIRQRIAEIIGEKVENIRLVIKGREVRDDRDISEVGADGEFEVLAMRPGDFFVYAQSIDDSCVTVVVSESDTIEAAKSRIEQQTAMNCREMSLFHKGKQLSGSEFLHTCDIGSGAILTLCNLQDCEICAKSIGCSSFHFKVRSSDTFGVVLSVIRFLCCSTSISYVSYEGIARQQSDSLASAGITTSAIVEFGDLIITARRNDQSITLLAQNDTHISAIRHEIAHRLSLNIAGLKLVCEGKQLKGGKKLGSLNLQPDSVLEIRTPANCYLWVKCASGKVRVDVADLSAPLSEVIEKCQSGRSVCIYNRTILSPNESIRSQKLSIGSVIEVLSYSTHVVHTVKTYDREVNVVTKRSANVGKLISEVNKVCEIHSESKAVAYANGRIVNNSELISEEMLWIVRPEERICCFKLKNGSCLQSILRVKDSIDAIKRKLQQTLIASQDEFVLRYNGRAVNSTDTLSKYPHRDLFDFELYLMTEPCVWLKTNTEKCRLLDLPSLNIRISELKSLCGASAPVTIFSGENALSEDFTLIDYQISPGARLTLISAEKVTEVSINPVLNDKFAFVETCFAQGYLVRFTTSDTWQTLISAFASILKVNSSKLVLFFKGVKFDQKATNPICEGGIIRLITENDEAAILRHLDGSFDVAFLSRSSSISELKYVLNVTSDLRLDSKVLEDYRSLAYYKITPCKLIEIVSGSWEVYTVNAVGFEPIRIVLISHFASVLTDLLDIVNDGGYFGVLHPIAYINGHLCTRKKTMISPKQEIWLLAATDICTFVSLVDGGDVTIYLQSSDSVADIISALAARIGVKKCGLRLFCKDSMLEMTEHMSLSEAKIRNCAQPEETNCIALLPSDIVVTINRNGTDIMKAVNVNKSVSMVISMFDEEGYIYDRLIFNDEVMDNMKTLSEYGISKDVRLCLLKKSAVWLTLQSLSGEKFTASLKHNEMNISALRSYAEKATGLPMSQLSLTWTGNLSDSEVYGTEEDIIIIFTGKGWNQGLNLKLFLHLTHFDDRITVLLEPFQTIEAITTKIGHSARVLIDGFEARAAATLSEYHLNENSNLQLVYCEDAVVVVTLPSGLKSVLPVGPHTSVLAFKKIIAALTLIPFSAQRLYCSDEELNDNTIIRDLGSDVDIVLRTAVEIVVVKTANGVTFAIQTAFSNTVESLKAKIAEETAVLPANQRIYYRNAKLSDAQTLHQYEFQSGDTIVMLTSEFIHLLVISPLSFPVPLYVPRFTTVLQVKKILSKRIGIQVGNISLVSKVEIKGKKSFATVRKDRNELKFIIKFATPGDSMIGLLRVCPESTLPLHFNASDTIAVIRQKAEAMLQKSINRLSYKEAVLDERLTAAQCNLTNFSTLSFD